MSCWPPTRPEPWPRLRLPGRRPALGSGRWSVSTPRCRRRHRAAAARRRRRDTGHRAQRGGAGQAHVQARVRAPSAGGVRRPWQRRHRRAAGGGGAAGQRRVQHTAADHIGLLREALRQLPVHWPGHRPGRRVPVRIDGAGATHDLLDWLTGQRLSYSVGFGLPVRVLPHLSHQVRGRTYDQIAARWATPTAGPRTSSSSRR